MCDVNSAPRCVCMLMWACCVAECLSLAHVRTRRELLATTGALFKVNFGATNWISPPPSEAACLPGDLSKDCIGVYKVPMVGRTSDYIGTKESLEKNAPGLKYVPPIEAPKSFGEALQVLQAQREAANDIQTVITAGRLEEAGIKLLNLIPRVTAAGEVVVASVAELQQKQQLQQTKMGDGIRQVQLARLQSELDDTVTFFGKCDISIGQGLRGEMGVVTAAQLNILSDLKDATIAFDDFLDSIPKNNWIWGSRDLTDN